MEFALHVLGCAFYAAGAAYYVIALVKLARSKSSE